jgi:outer membrane PBP1 activator LpoA protein
MRYGKIILIALAALLLAACGKGTDDQPKLMKEQRDALDKAKGVENTLKQQSNEQNKEMDKQSQ